MSRSLLNQTSTFPPSAGSGPLCTLNRFEQFSICVKVCAKCFYDRENEDSGPLSRKRLMEDAQPQTRAAVGRAQLPNALLGKRRGAPRLGRGGG